MSADAMSLAEVQRRMAAAVMTPLTAEEDMRAAAVDGRAMAEEAAAFIAPNSRLTAFERLEIYNRQYWFRVIDALVEDFPALRAVVGGTAFHALAVAYLTEHPSRSFTLRNLGSKMVEWLEQHPRYAGRRHALAVDVARVEWAYVEAFDHAEEPPLTLADIAKLSGGSRLRLQPHVRLLALEYAADDLALALHAREKRQSSEAGVARELDGETPAKLPRIRRRPVYVAAHRVDLTVYYRRLRQEEYRTLVAIENGVPLGAALEAGFERSAIAAERRPDLVREWFAAWAELGWICAASAQSE